MVLRDIFLVALPIISLGAAGNIIGLSTLTGGAIINLGDVLAIIIGALILRQQGSGWLWRGQPSLLAKSCFIAPF